MLKKIILPSLGIFFLFLVSSCSTTRSTISKNAVAFPGMTVSRSDYKLSNNVTSTVKVKEFSLFGLRFARVEGEKKRVLRQGYVNGFNLDPASQIAVYKMLETNPEFDYLTNIRIKKEFQKKWFLLFTTYKTDVTVTAKGITLKTEK
jgi:hypothetical protein